MCYMSIFIFDKHVDVADMLRGELTVRNLANFARYNSACFPDNEEVWRNTDLVVMNPMSGYSCLPSEWRTETEQGQITGLVLLKHLVPLSREERSKIPVLLRSTLYDCGPIHDLSSGEAPYAHSERVLREIGFDKVYLGHVPSTVVAEVGLIEQMIADHSLRIRPNNDLQVTC